MPGDRAVQLRPSMVRRFTQCGGRQLRSVEMMDRIINAVGLPRWLRPHGPDFDLFHIIDHSYAHLVTKLTPGRSSSCATTAMRPGSHAGSPGDRWWVERWESLLGGLRAARKIVCGSVSTRDELVSYNVVPAERVRSCRTVSIQPAAYDRMRAPIKRAATLIGPLDHRRAELLHVGSTITRKRIDVLLEVLLPCASATRPPISSAWGTRLARSGTARGQARSRRPHYRAAIRRSACPCGHLPPSGIAAATFGSRGIWPAGCRGDGLRHAGGRQ